MVSTKSVVDWRRLADEYDFEFEQPPENMQAAGGNHGRFDVRHALAYFRFRFVRRPRMNNQFAVSGYLESWVLV